jgi:hypothetical protein
MAHATILDLLNKGKMVALASGMAADRGERFESDILARSACGYLHAATVILNASNLELDDHPDFVVMRQWALDHRR